MVFGMTSNLCTFALHTSCEESARLTEQEQDAATTAMELAALVSELGGTLSN